MDHRFFNQERPSGTFYGHYSNFTSFTSLLPIQKSPSGNDSSTSSTHDSSTSSTHDFKKTLSGNDDDDDNDGDNDARLDVCSCVPPPDNKGGVPAEMKDLTVSIRSAAGAGFVPREVAIPTLHLPAGGSNLAGPVSEEAPQLGVAAHTWNSLPAPLQGLCAGPQTAILTTSITTPKSSPTGEQLQQQTTTSKSRPASEQLQ